MLNPGYAKDAYPGLNHLARLRREEIFHVFDLPERTALRLFEARPHGEGEPITDVNTQRVYFVRLIGGLVKNGSFLSS